jgi:hypothetical protein
MTKYIKISSKSMYKLANIPQNNSTSNEGVDNK